MIRQIAISLIVLCLLFAASECLAKPVSSTSAASASVTKARVLNFSDKVSAGNVVLLDKPRYFISESGKSITLKAQGRVQVPAGKFVIFFPNFAYYRNPQLLAALPADAFDYVLMRYVSMDESEANLGDAALAYLNRFSGIRVLFLEGVEITDKGLSKLTNLNKLEFIALYLTEVNGSFMQALAGNKSLRQLGLSNCAFVAANVRYLPTFPALEKLEVTRLKLSDKDVKVIAQCKRLRILSINKNPDITDKSIDYLLAMPALKEINISNTAVTDRGMARLKKAGIRTGVVSTLLDEGSTHKGPNVFQDANGGIFAPLSRGRKL